MTTFLIKKESCQEFGVNDMSVTACGPNKHHSIKGPVVSDIFAARAATAHGAGRETTETVSVCGAARTASLVKVIDLLLVGVPFSIAGTDSVLFADGLACLVISIVDNDPLRRVRGGVRGGGGARVAGWSTSVIVAL
jgi:hypothetical protein